MDRFPDNSMAMHLIEKRYDILEVLGQGAYGVVYLARSIAARQLVALKLVDKTSLSSTQRGYLASEIEILYSMDHPHIIKMLFFDENDAFAIIVMEYARGGSLSSIIRQRKRERRDAEEIFSINEVSKIMKGVFQALNYLHERSIVHHDIKSENILIMNPDDLSTVKIADFGLAFIRNKLLLTSQMGTVTYMAPELFTGETHTQSVDIWSAGILMYKLLSRGAHPFWEKIPIDKAIVEDLKCPPWNFPPNFPGLAKNLILKLCRVDPTSRLFAQQALEHPFITGNPSAEIPLSYTEMLDLFERKEKFLRLVKAVFFLKSLETVAEKTAPLPCGTAVLALKQSEIADTWHINPKEYAKLHTINKEFVVKNPSRHSGTDCDQAK